MSNEGWEAIEKIIESLTIFNDGARGTQTPRNQSRIIIAETVLRLPESVREKVVKDAVFITIGGAYGCVLLMVHSELKSEGQLIKTSEGLVWVKIEAQIIILNFAEMEKDELDEENMRTTVAHEIAQFILGHHRSVGRGRVREKEADDLIEKWGFKRAYQNYERFARS